MCSLLNFPTPPPDGTITVCEANSELVNTDNNNEDILNRYKDMMNIPDITVERSPNTLVHESAKSAFIEHKQTVLKKIIATWHENGCMGVLEEIANMKGEVSPWICKTVCGILMSIRWLNSLHGSIFPHLLLSSEDLVCEFSHTLDWQSSPVKVFAWHPHVMKFAAALNDDSVKMYTVNNSLVPTLKHKLQKYVADIAWRPFSSSEVALACQSCVLVWHVDPKSLATRPSTACVQVLSQTGHSPVTSLCWCPQGGALITASPADTAMMVWDVSMERCEPLRRFGGGGVSFINWSPDGSKVFAATPSTVFRVWHTQKWEVEKWSNPCSRCQTACWSPDGSTLLFATYTEPKVYSLRFGHLTGTTETSIGGSKAAVCVVDLTQVVLGSTEEYNVGGCVQSMEWDPLGQRLAVLFRESNSSNLVAVFKTKVHPVLEIISCGFVRGPTNTSAASICFQPTFDSGALLTVVWSNGKVSHIPLYFLSPRALEHGGLISGSGVAPGNGHTPSLLFSQD